MSKSLLLSADWDLSADSAGNIAVASDDLSLAQDAASAIRLFRGELYFNTAAGIPYFDQLLGKTPPISLMKAYFIQAALAVPGVVSAQCFITDWSDRVVHGQVQVTNASGQTTTAGF